MAKKARSAKHATHAAIREANKKQLAEVRTLHKAHIQSLRDKAKSARVKLTQNRQAEIEARKAARAQRRAEAEQNRLAREATRRARQVEREQKRRERAVKKQERITATRKKLVGKIKELKQKLAATYGKVDMLRDTNALYGALNPTLNPQGGIETIGKTQIEVDVGYGGPAKHSKGKATIADIARFHNEGLGNNPQRKIIVSPNKATTQQMRADADRAIAKLKRDAGL
jgi:hypothetical protein